MNNDLISRSELKKAIEEEICNFELPISASEIVPIIDNASTVEARPQGKWEHNKFDEHYCNKCGSFALWSEEADGCYYEERSNFCPNCGADMRGEGE